MRDKPISDLRRRMIADMTVRSFRTRHGTTPQRPCRNPHRACGNAAAPFPEGFRTTAPMPADRHVMGPSSETLYTKGGSHRQG